MNPLGQQIQVDVVTGALTVVPVRSGITARDYFNSLSILNKSAHLYGFVYLATPEALALLEAQQPKESSDDRKTSE